MYVCIHVSVYIHQWNPLGDEQNKCLRENNAQYAPLTQMHWIFTLAHTTLSAFYAKNILFKVEKLLPFNEVALWLVLSDVATKY